MGYGMIYPNNLKMPLGSCLSSAGRSHDPLSSLIYLLNMVISSSQPVSLPEGIIFIGITIYYQLYLHISTINHLYHPVDITFFYMSLMVDRPSASGEGLWLHCASAGIPPDGTSYLGGNQQCLGSWDRVNPFWSRETQVEATRMTCGNVGGSQQNTPQKGHVETDPIELFRLRCLRDAEEKFRKGLAQMAGDNWSHGSVGSFVSAGDEEAFVPPPPPGPPPKSPPRTQQSTNLLCFGGTNLGQFIPPFPQSMDGSGNSRHVMGENAGETLSRFCMRIAHPSNMVIGLAWLTHSWETFHTLQTCGGEWFAMQLR